MNRRQLAFIVLINALVSLFIALGVSWAFELRRPDPEELAAIFTPQPQAVLAAPPVVATATGNADQPSGLSPTPEQSSTTPEPETGDTAGDSATDSTVDAATGETVYTVQAGDSLLAIANRYNVTVDELVSANNLTNPDFLFSGQQLVIPVREGSQPTPAAGEPVVGGLRIAAVENPNTLGQEAVMLTNESNVPISLRDWRLERESGPTYTFGDTPLFPGGSIRVHSRAGDDTSIDLFWDLEQAVWQTGAEVRLLNAQGNLVNTYTVP